MRDWRSTDQEWNHEWHAQAEIGFLQVNRGERLEIVPNVSNNNDYKLLSRISDGRRGYVPSSCVERVRHERNESLSIREVT